MLSWLCFRAIMSKTLVTHGDLVLAFKALNNSSAPGKTPVGISTSGPGLVVALIGNLLTAIDKNMVPFLCQVVVQTSGPCTWVSPGSFAFPGKSTPVLQVRLTQVFLTSCHLLFYGSSRKSTCDQLVELTTGLVANIDPLRAIPDTTQFYTNSKAAYNRLSLAHYRAGDVGGPRSGMAGLVREGGVEVEVGVVEFHQGGVHL